MNKAKLKATLNWYIVTHNHFLFFPFQFIDSSKTCYWNDQTISVNNCGQALLINHFGFAQWEVKNKYGLITQMVHTSLQVCHQVYGGKVGNSFKTRPKVWTHKALHFGAVYNASVDVLSLWAWPYFVHIFQNVSFTLSFYNYIFILTLYILCVLFSSFFCLYVTLIFLNSSVSFVSNRLVVTDSPSLKGNRTIQAQVGLKVTQMCKCFELHASFGHIITNYAKEVLFLAWIWALQGAATWGCSSPMKNKQAGLWHIWEG